MISSFRSTFLGICLLVAGCNQQPDYLNTTLPLEERVDDLVSRMNVDQKIAQMSHLAPGIEALNIDEYSLNLDNPYGQISIEFPNEDAPIYRERRPWEKENWDAWEEMELGCLDGGYWNEALHGVARSGLATSFPQSIGLGSTWNPALVQQMTDVTSTEARIHNNVYGKKLTYWSPTINILRDPRWGRNEESYTEDPFLLSRMAVAFVKGLQGDSTEKYLKAVATIKHFAANNSEFNRHDGSSDVSERWLREYFFPAYKAAVIEGGAMSVMSAYNAVNGVPASANSWLLDDILRKEWGFKGYVVSDCGAISDIVHRHKYETDPEKAVAIAVKAGTDLECETCGNEQFLYDKYLKGAFDKGYITEAEIDKAVKRILGARILLGEFDPVANVPYQSIDEDLLDCEPHQQLALDLARESMVLLKNDEILPLDRDELESIAVIGPNANVQVLGGYSGSPSVTTTPFEAIQQLVGTKATVSYAKGCLVSDRLNEEEMSEVEIEEMESFDKEDEMEKAVQLAKNSDAVILVVGTNLQVANEEADRSDLSLPGDQLELIQKVMAVNDEAVVVLINGMSLTIDWLDENVDGILEAWYPGQAGGIAIAETLFGDYNPGGKLPVTFYKNLEDLPEIGDYDISNGRGYWFFEGDVLYPFGHGLSYTAFEMNNLELSESEIPRDKNLTVSIDLMNVGELAGDEVVQVYIKDLESSEVQPFKKLKAFERVTLNAQEKTTITFDLCPRDFMFWSEKNKGWTLEPGEFEIQVGNSSANVMARKIITASESVGENGEMTLCD